MIDWLYDPHKSENCCGVLFGGLHLQQNPQLSSTLFCSDLLLHPPPPPPSRIISHRYAPARETSRWKHFCFFVVLINFQLSVKHFSALPCYFMKREDIWKNAEFCNQLWISGVTQVTLHQLSSKWLEILMQS